MSLYLIGLPPFTDENNEKRIIVKVGCTSSASPQSRMNALQTGNPIQLTLLHEVQVSFPFYKERLVHKAFKEFGGPFASETTRKDLGLEGGGTEWFNVPFDSLENVKSIMEIQVDLEDLKISISSAKLKVSKAMESIKMTMKRHAEEMESAKQNYDESIEELDEMIARYSDAISSSVRSEEGDMEANEEPLRGPVACDTDAEFEDILRNSSVDGRYTLRSFENHRVSRKRMANMTADDGTKFSREIENTTLSNIAKRLRTAASSARNR